MGFLKSLFSKQAKKEARPALNHPSLLMAGDIIKLDDSFALPAQLRGQSLEVKQVNTYEYEQGNEFEWVLQGNDNELLFMNIDDDDTQSLVFSRKINRETVGELFDLGQFSQLFDEPGNALIETKNQLADLSQWLGEQYRQCEFARMGYFHQQDFRQRNIEQETGDSFERYGAISDDERYGLEAEVYQDGETDVLVSLYRPLSDIREYWPRS